MALVVILTIAALANSGVTKTDFVNYQRAHYKNVEVSKLEFDGHTYHIFVGSDWGKVIDVTAKSSTPIFTKDVLERE